MLLDHTAVLVTLGTLVTGKHAQVRELNRIMSLGNRVRAKIQIKFKVTYFFSQRIEPKGKRKNIYSQVFYRTQYEVAKKC